jgi:hypothetical protein
VRVSSHPNEFLQMIGRQPGEEAPTGPIARASMPPSMQKR